MAGRERQSPTQRPAARGPAADEGLPKDRPKGIGRRIVSGFLSYGVIILVVYYLLEDLAGAETTQAAFAAITPAQRRALHRPRGA